MVKVSQSGLQMLIPQFYPGQQVYMSFKSSDCRLDGVILTSMMIDFLVSQFQNTQVFQTHYSILSLGSANSMSVIFIAPWDVIILLITSQNHEQQTNQSKSVYVYFSVQLPEILQNITSGKSMINKYFFKNKQQKSKHMYYLHTYPLINTLLSLNLSTQAIFYYYFYHMFFQLNLTFLLMLLKININIIQLQVLVSKFNYMNRFFGFFKQKILEAKQENKQQLQNIINAFQHQPYSNIQMLNHLQDIKTNYLEWTIMISNQASTGLYFTQLHNKSSCLKKVKALREGEERRNKKEICLGQMERTLKELKDIEKLNYNWANSINQKVEQVSIILAQDRQHKKQRQRSKQKYQKQKSNQTFNEKQQQQNEQIPQKQQINNQIVVDQIMKPLKQQTITIQQQKIQKIQAIQSMLMTIQLKQSAKDQQQFVTQEQK